MADIKDRVSGLSRKTLIKLLVAAMIVIVVFFVVTSGGNDGQEITYRQLAEGEYPQQLASQIIPEYRSLERTLACIVDGKVYVMASRGEKPTSGYEIEIDKMELLTEGDTSNLQVYVLFKDPQAGAALTQTVTYPLVVAETDLEFLPDKVEMKIQYKE